MKLLAPLRGRWGSLLVIAIVQAIVGFVFGGLAAFPWTHVLRWQPEGDSALQSGGSRFVLDLLHQHATAVTTGALAAGVGVGLWAALWFVLGGVLPALFATEEAPALHRAMASSLRRFPSLASLAAMACVGYAIAGVIGVFGVAHASHKALTMVNSRSVDLQRIAAFVPVAIIALLVSVWHDAARTQAMATAMGSLPSAGAALTRMFRSPLQTFGRAAAYWMLGALGPLLAFGLSSLLSGHESTTSLCVLVIFQQVAVAWRLVARALWFASLAAPWRRLAPRTVIVDAPTVTL